MFSMWTRAFRARLTAFKPQPRRGRLCFQSLVVYLEHEGPSAAAGGEAGTRLPATARVLPLRTGALQMPHAVLGQASRGPCPVPTPAPRLCNPSPGTPHPPAPPPSPIHPTPAPPSSPTPPPPHLPPGAPTHLLLLMDHVVDEKDAVPNPIVARELFQGHTDIHPLVGFPVAPPLQGPRLHPHRLQHSGTVGQVTGRPWGATLRPSPRHPGATLLPSLPHWGLLPGPPG